MSTIAIENMEFHSFHGCFKEEQIIGNTFIVDVYMDTDTKEAELSDNLEHTVNYADVHALIKKEMAINSKLLEHVAKRIMVAIEEAYPQIDAIELKIAKMNPPIGGKVESVSLTLNNME
jgi:dihydroneopterin aldolase